MRIRGADAERALINGFNILVYVQRELAASPYSLPWLKRAFTRTRPYYHPDLKCLGFRPVRNKFIWFVIHPVYAILLQQPKWTRRGIHSQHARKFQKSISRKRIIQLKNRSKYWWSGGNTSPNKYILNLILWNQDYIYFFTNLQKFAKTGLNFANMFANYF